MVGDKKSSSVIDRKNAVNRAHKDLAGLIKGYWRRRTFEYTSSSTPALTALERTYNVPTPTGSVFDSPARLYYRDSGRTIDVPFKTDSVWLSLSATRDADAGYPDYVRLIQTATAVRIELNRPLIQSFIDNIGTLVFEYNIAVANMVADTDLTLLPRNYVHRILPVAAHLYGISQSDWELVDRMKKESDLAMADLRRHDLTRTGRARHIKPSHNYLGPSRGSGNNRITRREYVDA